MSTSQCPVFDFVEASQKNENICPVVMVSLQHQQGNIKKESFQQMEYLESPSDPLKMGP